MTQTQEENSKEKIELQCRKLLLDSYSSQLTTHARLIIGFAIILLSLLEVKGAYLKSPISCIQDFIIYLGIMLVASVLWFLIMRHLTYGVLTNAATFAEPKGDYGVAETPSVDASELDNKKAVDVALVSLGTNASVVISPSMPGQTNVWATVASDNAKDMLVGEGYWVFMTATATLAGFEVTPIYWIAP